MLRMIAFADVLVQESKIVELKEIYSAIVVSRDERKDS